MKENWARKKIFDAYKNNERLIYFITDGSFSDEEILKKLKEACQAGVALVQIRDKDRTDEAIFPLLLKSKELCQQYKTALVVDDRVYLAKKAGIGVHLGTSDMPIDEARKILGPEPLIGATAKNIKRAKEAEEQGADYLGSGAVYPTTTHVVTKITSVETIRQIADAVDIPVYALGGLNKDNLEILENSHIAGICAVTALMKADDTAKAVKELKEAFDQLDLR